MNNDIAVFYYDGDSFSKLKEFDGKVKAEKIKELPVTFFIEDSGFYKIGEKVYDLNHEGLYRFTNEKGEKQQYYHHKKNADLLVKSLMLCFDFFQFINKKGFVTYYPMLNIFLKNNLVKNFSLVEFTKIILTSRGVPWRQGYFVSKESEEALGTFVELWDELSQSWGLYWLDANMYLGATGVGKTYTDVIEEVWNETDKIKSLITLSNVEESIFDESEMLKELVRLFTQKKSEVNDFILKQAFPVMKRNFASTKAFAERKHFHEDLKIYLDSKSDMEYKIYFQEHEDIKSFFYGFQYHVFAGKIIQTCKNLD